MAIRHFIDLWQLDSSELRAILDELALAGGRLGVEYEAYAFLNRATGPYWWAYFAMMTCNVISPQLMWFRKLRRSLLFTFFISIVVNIGMWFERYVIIMTSLHRDYLPSSWSMHYPSPIDIGVYIGTIGLFFTFFLLLSQLRFVVSSNCVMAKDVSFNLWLGLAFRNTCIKLYLVFRRTNK